MSSPTPGETVVQKTSASAPTPAKTLEALYTRPFQCHGSIGPSCAVAQWEAQKLTVWTHSQGVFPLRADLAKVFGLKPADIHCIHAEGSGCYGHNGADDVALDAALLARATGGRPVKLQWMREDEFMWEPYGSAMVMKLSGGIDAQGNIVAWSHELWSHTHSTRPGSSAGVNLLAARHLAQPFAPVPPADVPQPSGGAARNAISVTGAIGLRIERNTIQGVRDSPPGQPAAGIDIEPDTRDRPASDLHIVGNTIEDNAGPGILLELEPNEGPAVLATGIEISGNTIVRNALRPSPPKRAGIVLAGGQDGGAGTLILKNNVIHDNGGPGILEAHFLLQVDASGNDVTGNDG